MTCRARVLALLLAAAALLALAAPGLAAPKSKGGRDLIMLSPAFASANVRSIALLPVSTYDRNFEAQRVVSTLWGKDFKDTGYRWVSAMTAGEMVRVLLGDSTLVAVAAEVLKNARVDSLRAPQLCAKLRVDAVLSVRVDQWEKHEAVVKEGLMTGVIGYSKPGASVYLKAALVDSSGALLWSASGAETVEGEAPQDKNAVGYRHTGLSETPLLDSGKSPEFVDVVDRLLTRWATQFPKPAAAEAVK